MGSFFGTEPSGSMTTTTTNDIPDWQKSYVQDYMTKAQTLQNNMPSYMPSTNTTQGINALTNVSGQLPVDASQYASNTLNGDYLNSSQFNNNVDAAIRRTIPNVNANFTNAGQYGDSSGRDLAQTQAVSDAYSGVYNDERNRQQQVLQMSPSIQQSAYMPAQQQLAAGSLQDQIARQPYQDQWNALNMYRTDANGNFGSTGTSNTPIYTDTASDALGLAGMFFKR